jgi:5-formyltetrahydrofolate cyclo-ligase
MRGWGRHGHAVAAPHGRIPNFVGAEVAALRLLDIEPWKSATAIKVNPDSPQRPLRAEALRRGITVFLPTPRLRGGFKKLDPRRIPRDKIEEAAAISRRLQVGRLQVDSIRFVRW